MALISREEVLEYLDKRRTYELMDGRNKAYGKGIRDAIKDIEALPSVPAVPLDKLCEWLAAEHVTIPCHLCDHYENGRCSVENDMKTPCPSGTDEWRKALKKGVEG